MEPAIFINESAAKKTAQDLFLTEYQITPHFSRGALLGYKLYAVLDNNLVVIEEGK